MSKIKRKSSNDFVKREKLIDFLSEKVDGSPSEYN